MELVTLDLLVLVANLLGEVLLELRVLEPEDTGVFVELEDSLLVLVTILLDEVLLDRTMLDGALLDETLLDESLLEL